MLGDLFSENGVVGEYFHSNCWVSPEIPIRNAHEYYNSITLQNSIASTIPNAGINGLFFKNYTYCAKNEIQKIENFFLDNA